MECASLAQSTPPRQQEQAQGDSYRERSRNRVRPEDDRPSAEDHRRLDRLLHSACHWWVERHPHYEYEDVYSIASAAMVAARETYDPSRGCKLSTWTYNRIKYALLSHFSGGAKEASRCRTFSNLESVSTQLDAEGLPVGAAAGPQGVPDRSRFDPERMLGELSDDAGALVRLVLGRFEGDPSKITRREGRGILRRALEHLGWEVSRFMSAITEVRTSL